MTDRTHYFGDGCEPAHVCPLAAEHGIASERCATCGAGVPTQERMAAFPAPATAVPEEIAMPTTEIEDAIHAFYGAVSQHVFTICDVQPAPGAKAEARKEVDEARGALNAAILCAISITAAERRVVEAAVSLRSAWLDDAADEACQALAKTLGEACDALRAAREGR